ncbi:hypothetical protein F6X40_12690 [Paraburkholderia sp. UCT31]|uniref:immunity protein Imm33 domain-containing protein n=1 Tax=Paraburkholderia sp. UCT31 TaxID=2615209 RepID=UPI00165642D9|nr:hypothetical protein [Paraburkholderia sp. UCT31]MBC8737656.1 hypothetical protein [Paraburkholderia sp. UCT31]
MILTSTIDTHEVLLECDVALEPAAKDVLRTLAELSRPDAPLRDGLRVRFGWSLLTLRTEPAGLRVCEPHFRGDPERELNPRLDTTLRVLVEQSAWLHQLGEAGSDVFFDQQIVVAGDALHATNIFALRGEVQKQGDSGWSVAPVPSGGQAIDMHNLRALPVHRLLDARPGLLAVLTLPAGYLVRLKANRVVEVNAPDGRVVWLLNGGDPAARVTV